MIECLIMEYTEYTISTHASKQMQRRGVSHEELEIVLLHGSRKYVKGGCVKRFITQKRGEYLVKEGVIQPQMTPRVCDINVVICESTRVIVTVERALIRRKDKRSHGFKS